MKKLIPFYGLALLALASCASSETQTENSDLATSEVPGEMPVSADSSVTSDPLLATDPSPTAANDKSAADAISEATGGAESAKDENPFANLSDVPKTPEKSTPAEPKMNTSSSLADAAKTNTDAIPANPATGSSDSLLATPAAQDNSDSSNSATAEPIASAPAKDPVPSAVMIPAPRKRKTTTELMEDYQQRTEEYEKFQSEVEDRELIPHEGGSFQVGLDYTRNAFPNYDYDLTAGKKFFDAQGAIFSVLYFPIHNLTFGRFGLGLQVGGYLTKYVTTNSSDSNVEINKKLGFVTYGGRATYEFQYWLGQLFVPHVFVGYEQVRVSAYQLAAAGINYPANTFSSQVYGAGLNLNLNRLEPRVAGSALANIGVRKFYLAYSYMQRSDSSDSGASHLLGLRFEY